MLRDVSLILIIRIYIKIQLAALKKTWSTWIFTLRPTLCLQLIVVWSIVVVWQSLIIRSSLDLVWCSLKQFSSEHTTISSTASWITLGDILVTTLWQTYHKWLSKCTLKSLIINARAGMCRHWNNEMNELQFWSSFVGRSENQLSC